MSVYLILSTSVVVCRNVSFLESALEVTNIVLPYISELSSCHLSSCWRVFFESREIEERGAKYFSQVFCRFVSLPTYAAKAEGCCCCFRECPCKDTWISPLVWACLFSFLALIITCNLFQKGEVWVPGSTRNPDLYILKDQVLVSLWNWKFECPSCLLHPISFLAPL